MSRRAQQRGLCVALLGIDGSGKSTLLQGIDEAPPAWSAGVAVRHFSPLGLKRRGTPTDPHGRPPRNAAMSLLKGLFWLAEFTAGHRLHVAPELRRGRLVLFDRYLVDALVDPRRYRYGGPGWLLRLLCRLVPRPDLIVFLDAPVDVLESRKQEVDATEMARLRAAYLRLLDHEPRGRRVDVSGSIEQSLANLLDLLAAEAGAHQTAAATR
jgi:thymidylate kinase